MRKIIFIFWCLQILMPSFAQEIVWFKNDSVAQNYFQKLTPGFFAKKLSPLQSVYKITPVLASESLLSLENPEGILLSQKCHTIDFRGKSPNDPLYGFQYYLNNLSKPGKDIRAEEAWAFSTGGVNSMGDTLVLAFVDDGLDTLHPDLQQAIWRNYSEIAGDSADNDSNGYIDDALGYNASEGNGRIFPGAHGTSVAGVAGASGNNGMGVSGVCWKVKLLPVVISGVDESEVVAAYLYILNQRRLYNQSGGKKGAYIVSSNSSFGVFQQKPSDFPIWCAMYDSLGKEGIINAAATVNASVKIDNFGDIPSMCASSFLIVVSSTDSNDQNCNAGYSNTYVDLSAPGCDIYTTRSSATYAYESGTSFASPQVAAAAALLYATPCKAMDQLAKQFPDSAALLVKKYILQGTDPLSGAAAQTLSGGRLNIFNSLNALVTASCWNTGLGKKVDTKDFSFYPNPADGMLYFSENLNNFLLYDFTGAFLKVVNGTDLNCTALPSGIYFLNGVGANLKFTVAH